MVDVVEGLEPEELLPEGSDESFRHPIALGLGDGDCAGANPEGGESLLEVAAHVLAAVVVAQGEAGGNPGVVSSEVSSDTLPEWFARLVASLALGRMNADALGGVEAPLTAKSETSVPWSTGLPTPDGFKRRCTGGRWRPRVPRTPTRPPTAQRETALHALDVLVEPLVVHRPLAELALQLVDALVAAIALPGPQCAQPALQEGLPPQGDRI